MIRTVSLNDAAHIANIYNYYIENTVITFENTVVEINEISNRITDITEKGFPYIIYEDNDQLIGYAYLNTWRSRPAYNITLESSIYLDIHHTGKGIGKQLYEVLIEKAKAMELHSVIGGISLPNDASRKLHASLGFQLIGNFKEVGKKFNKLVDVEFWQLFL